MPPRKQKKPTAAAASRESAAEGGQAPDLASLARRFGKPAIAVLAAGLGVLWVMHMEKVALHQRLRRTLNEDERTSAWFAEQTRLIAAEHSPEAGGESSAPRPKALWIGRVSRLVLSQPQQADEDAEELLAFEMKDATLLAGRAGEHDGSTVYISVRGVRFPSGPPMEDESWVVSVTRNAEDNNFLTSAARLPAPP